MNIDRKFSIEMNSAFDDYERRIKELEQENAGLAERLSMYEQPAPQTKLYELLPANLQIQACGGLNVNNDLIGDR